ncbi:hypothetical protein [Burkholderia ubonensis]|uniref:hypothetical protein n=1 Tax=Burkholderia ubonensis TaxID=101571 RepID=UPI001E468B26|nr:hypothetical protein [Burkholderia ubonensis]
MALPIVLDDGHWPNHRCRLRGDRLHVVATGEAERIERCTARGPAAMTTQAKQLDALDIDVVMRRLQQHPGDIVLELRISIPEADVLCCRYKGERFNVKFDLDYGVFVDRIGALSDSDMADIVRWLVA